jgi:hypothetical protein
MSVPIKAIHSILVTFTLIGVSAGPAAAQEREQAQPTTPCDPGWRRSLQGRCERDTATSTAQPVSPAAEHTATSVTSSPAGKLTKQEQQRLKREQKAAQRAAKAQKEKEDEARANVPQPDIVQECVAVRKIVFRPAGFASRADHTGVWGTISNNCGREAEVSIVVNFYEASGDLLDLEPLTKLVPVGDTPFSAIPQFYSETPYLYKAGKVMSVSVHVF